MTAEPCSACASRHGTGVNSVYLFSQVPGWLLPATQEGAGPGSPVPAGAKRPIEAPVLLGEGGLRGHPPPVASPDRPWSGLSPPCHLPASARRLLGGCAMETWQQWRHGDSADRSGPAGWRRSHRQRAPLAVGSPYPLEVEGGPRRPALSEQACVSAPPMPGMTARLLLLCPQSLV